MKLPALFRRSRKQAPDPFFAEPVTRIPAPRFEDPHGIATDETLAGLRVLAESGDTVVFAAPAVQPDEPALTFTAAPPPPPMPFSGISQIWVERITYPEPGDLSYDHARHYRETLRHIGKATGTSTSLEDTGTWTLPALDLSDGTGVSL